MSDGVDTNLTREKNQFGSFLLKIRSYELIRSRTTHHHSHPNRVLRVHVVAALQPDCPFKIRTGGHPPVEVMQAEGSEQQAAAHSGPGLGAEQQEQRHQQRGHLLDHPDQFGVH